MSIWGSKVDGWVNQWIGDYRRTSVEYQATSEAALLRLLVLLSVAMLVVLSLVAGVFAGGF
ncbi:MAG: hypothetical protein H0V48_09700 [Nocardioidaceae bacterium]|nr:hypothetical protein [Nocardioidaceae bacterium]